MIEARVDTTVRLLVYSLFWTGLGFSMTYTAHFLTDSAKGDIKTSPDSAVVIITMSEALIHLALYPGLVGIILTVAALFPATRALLTLGRAPISVDRDALPHQLDRLLASLDEIRDDLTTANVELEHVQHQRQQNQALIDLTRTQAEAVRSELGVTQRRGNWLAVLLFVMSIAVAIVFFIDRH